MTHEPQRCDLGRPREWIRIAVAFGQVAAGAAGMLAVALAVSRYLT